MERSPPRSSRTPVVADMVWRGSPGAGIAVVDAMVFSVTTRALRGVRWAVRVLGLLLPD
jgi:hypothetical protein